MNIATPVLRILLLPSILLTLASCGGGLAATNITADRWMYGSLTTITVDGPNLDKGITLIAPKCTGIAEVAGGTEILRTYTCTPNATGPITFSIIGGNVQLRAITHDVPAPQVTVVTTMGNIVLELDPTAAPLSVNNFLKYVNDGFYTNLIFHRVIPGFVIQGGGFDNSLTAAKTRDPIKLEVPNGLSNLRGTVAMARSAAADSATSQFYINTVDNVNLDTLGGGYAVFGKVVNGMENVERIEIVPTVSTPFFENLPQNAVIITSATQTK
jgi:peptidyl-prolyl cis-trans isomerase A (cyclophilin A)